MANEEFYKRVKGPMQNYEDWYYLTKTEEGAGEVVHQWSHVSPKLQSNSGSKKYTVDEFLGTADVDIGAKAALKEWLARA
jgi:hypothetical protein